MSNVGQCYRTVRQFEASRRRNAMNAFESYFEAASVVNSHIMYLFQSLDCCIKSAAGLASACSGAFNNVLSNVSIMSVR